MRQLCGDLRRLGALGGQDRGSQVEGEQVEQPEAGAVEGSGRAQHAQALVLQVGLGLDDLDRGHPSGIDQGPVDVEDLLGAAHGGLCEHHGLVGAQQIAIGVDHLPDRLRYGRPEPQPVPLFAEPGRADRRQGHVDAAAAQERLIDRQNAAGAARPDAGDLARVVGPGESDGGARGQERGDARRDIEAGGGDPGDRLAHRAAGEAEMRHESVLGDAQAEFLGDAVDIGAADGAVVAQGQGHGVRQAEGNAGLAPGFRLPIRVGGDRRRRRGRPGRLGGPVGGTRLVGCPDRRDDADRGGRESLPM